MTYEDELTRELYVPAEGVLAWLVEYHYTISQDLNAVVECVRDSGVAAQRRGQRCRGIGRLAVRSLWEPNQFLLMLSSGRKPLLPSPANAPTCHVMDDGWNVTTGIRACEQ